MKRLFLLRSSACILFVFLFCFCSAQDTTLDASKFVNGKTIKLAADFTKDFNIIFKNNKKSEGLQVIIMSDDETPEVLKSGFGDADKNSYRVSFASVDNGAALEVNTRSGEKLKLTTGPLQLMYGDVQIAIINRDSRKEVDGKIPPPPAPSLPLGIELHDALLAKHYYDESNDSLLVILGKLKKPSPPTYDIDELRKDEAYGENPFIKALLDSFQAKKDRKSLPGHITGGHILGSLFKSVGNVDVTTVADGIARFLVKRTKEELTIAFFEHFKKLINDEKYLDVRLLFPITLENLNAIDEEIYQFENYITALREGFEKDLSLLLDNMPSVIEEGRFKDYFTSKPNLKYSVLLTLFTGRELVNGTHPGKVIEMFPDEYLDGLTEKNAAGSIRTLQLVSSSLRSRGQERYWTTLDSIQMIYKNDRARIAAKFYLGLLYEKSKDIQFEKSTLQDFLLSIANNEEAIGKYVDFITQLGKKCHDVESAVAQLKKKDAETPSIDVYNRMFHAFADVLEKIITLQDLPGISTSASLSADVRNYLKLFRDANDLALNVVRKNYGSAIVNVYNIYLVATEKKQEISQQTLTNNASLFDNSAAKNSKDSTKKKIVDPNKTAENVSAFIKKYGNFMANVVKANNSEEVSSAIEAAALPVGSATIKRHSNLNVSLNAYTGLFLGTERIRYVDSGFHPNSYGITAPVGFAVSKGFNWEKSYGWSLSVFFSVVDLGAPVAFRFKDDKTEKLPTIQLKDIVSPGVFASVGFPSVPISMNLGWQSGPVLRKVDAQLATRAASSYSRWSVSFVVDIPLLNFHTSRKSGEK